MRTVHIGLLGSSFLAEFYMQGLANVNGQKVIANYSRSKKRATSFAKQWTIPESTTSLKKMIARRDIDVFMIALPNESHLPVSLALSKARQNQVCTKPLARNSREAKRMLEAARKSDMMHGYMETEVFAPAVIKGREIVDTGSLGRTPRPL